MWRHRYGFVCALLAMFAALELMSFAQAVDPSTLPLIQFADLTYAGAFRLPREFANGDSFTQGGLPITFNPGRNSLFVGNHKGTIAEVAVPSLVNTNDITQLRYATFLQGFYEPTEGTISQITGGDSYLSGLLVSGNRLYGDATVYYDANNWQRTSHYSRSTVLSQPGVVGMKQVWNDAATGWVDGYMATVPAEWQARLGGPAVTGQCCIPVAGRTSWGPSAFAFNPADITSAAKVSATPLLYYTDGHPTLGTWLGNGTTYNGSTQITGMAMLAGTRTVLYFGRQGIGAFCYGEGTTNQSLAGTTAADGALYCYDPTDASKGSHGYPYAYQIWAYDLNELAAVKAGTKNPWDVRPYGVWQFSLPFVAAQTRIGGIGYDPSRQIIYIAQMYADQDTYEYRPLIHALKVGAGAQGAPLPTPDTTPLPVVNVTTGATISPTITAMTLTSNKLAPQPANTTITFTATPTGGIAPHQYKFLVHNGVQWTMLQDWSTTNTFDWTPTAANSQFRVGVWVRQAGKTADTAEFTQSLDFAIGAPTNATTPYVATQAVTISADKAAPQAAGSTITWTATPTGGLAPQQYKWLLHNGVQWTVVQDWSTSNRFVWTPAIPNSQYRVGVWVRSNGGTVDAGEATNSTDFAINGTATTTTTTTTTPTPPPPTTAGALLTAVSLTPNVSAPQPANTTITFTAIPNGGAAPQQYKFLIHNGVAWSAVTPWTTTNTFNWTPTAANSQYRVGVWVRSAGNTADVPEITNSIDFAISAATTASPTPPPPTTTTALLTAVSISPNKPAPQAANTTITFTATPNGGAAPQQYKWLVHDGVNWNAVTGWSTTNTFSWTPSSANSAYRIGVWVRSAGNTVDAPEITNSIDFGITAATTTAPPPTTPTSTAPLTAVMLSVDRIAPQQVGTTINLVATPTGGAAPQQYKWLIHDGVNWNAVTPWTTSNTFAWTPTAANSAYRVGIWVRSAGNTIDAAEITNSMDYPIIVATAPPPTTSAPRITDLRISSNMAAPQTAGTTVTFTATPTGGAAPQQYKWLVHNGVAWTAVTGWSTSNTFPWTPASANSAYRIGVWVRSAGNTVDAAEFTASMDFAIR